MNRIIIGLAPSILILVMCSWLVHLEGQSYRRRFRETARDQLTKRLVRRQEAPTPDQPPVPGTHKDQGGPDASPGRVSRVPNLGPLASQRQAKEPSYQESIGKSLPNEIAPPPKAIDIVRPSPSPSLTPEPKRSAPPLPKNGHWPVDPIPWKDPLKLTHDEEVKIGKAVHEVIRQHHHVLPSAEEAAFHDHLHDLVLPLLELRSRKDGDPRIYLIRSGNAFAFSHLGGYIYLSTFLSQLIPDDVELEFILAHEFAHLDTRDGIEKAAREVGAEARRPNEPGLAQRIYHQIADGYDSEQEYAADKWACQQLVNLKRPRHDIRMFFVRLKDYNARKQGVEPQKPIAGLDAEVQDVEHHWQSHPVIPFRLDRLKTILDAPPSQPAVENGSPIGSFLKGRSGR
jgi:hypothetical protein